MSETGGASLTINHGVATILFDRKNARNAMLHATWRALPGLVTEAEGDRRVRAIVLRGAGTHFGSGNDIAEFGKMRRDPVSCHEYGRSMADAMGAVENASKPVIAAIEGNCYGASVALALTADFRVSAADARFAITPAKLGALYLRSDLYRLVAAVGKGQARRMIFTAVAIDATEAHTIGLVDKISETAQFDEELDLVLQAILRGSPFTLRHSKRMLRCAGHGETTIEDEESIGWFVDAMQGEDFAEGYAAFMEKRAPNFVKAL
jgi:enoyl-CoA hydratase/carnithine racemase